jgi:RNA polymerase sigma factor (sigma-70 family)
MMDGGNICAFQYSMTPSGQARTGEVSMAVHEVTSNTTADLQNLIDRLRRGDPAARYELLQRAHSHLLRIAGSIFEQDFPGLRGRHDLESVVSEVWIRLVAALEATQPQSVDGFLGLVFHKVRQVLLDMARRQRREDAHRYRPPAESGDSNAQPAFEGADSSNEPGRLAVLTEFHQEVEKLPDDQRMVFELRYYAGFSQVEIAQIRGLPPKQVSRLWLAATRRLALWLKEFASTC